MLETVDTFDMYTNEAATKWLSGEFTLHLLISHVFKTSMQISRNDASPFQDVTVTQP